MNQGRVRKEIPRILGLLICLAISVYIILRMPYEPFKTLGIIIAIVAIIGLLFEAIILIQLRKRAPH